MEHLNTSVDHIKVNHNNIILDQCKDVMPESNYEVLRDVVTEEEFDCYNGSVCWDNITVSFTDGIIDFVQVDSFDNTIVVSAYGTQYLF